jgi:hypothetical protein
MAAYRSRLISTIELLLVGVSDLQTGHSASALQCDRVKLSGSTWFESLGRARGDVEPEAVCGHPVEVERGVRVWEMKMGSHLDRAVTCVQEVQADALTSDAISVEDECARADANRARAR